MNPRNLMLLMSLFALLVSANVSSADAPVGMLLPKDLPEGWALIHSPQIYTEKTLFERIDGQAELFFKYGFQKSAFAVYQDKKNEKAQVEVDLYDMGNVLQAFGIFSRFRSEDRPAGVGLESYIEDASLLFYKGRYFVMLYATESDPPVLKQWAKMVSLNLPDPSPPPREIGYFPKDGLKPGSIQYFPEGLLGYQFLRRGFQGTYVERVEEKVKQKVEVKEKAGENEISLFLAIFENPKEALSALKIYKDHLSKKGKVDFNLPTQFGSNGLRGEDPYRGKVLVVPKGPFLAGVMGFNQAGNAEKLLEEFVKNIR